MTDRIAIDTVAADCERYWRAAGIKRRVAAEMRAELEQHLIEASTDGRTPESVVGADTATFAIEWAEATGRSQDALPTWDEVFRRRKRRFNALAFMDVEPAIQLIVFIATSLVALILLQRFVRHGDEDQHPIGANRFIGRTAVVLEAIERTATAGRVRMDTEEWRATTDGDPIAVGTEVRILEVRGTRLVVESTDFS
jgi:membrane protein implicated in regulation of membrane protease activity